MADAAGQGSAQPGIARRAYPGQQTGCPLPGNRDRAVPVFTVVRSAEEEPGCVPAASPRVRRRPSPWPPSARSTAPAGSSRHVTSSGTRRARPRSARFEPVSFLKDPITPVPRVLLSATLAGPAPSGSTGTPRLCQGCSRPPRHHPAQAAPSFTALPRQDGGEGLSPPLEQTAPHDAGRHTATRWRWRPRTRRRARRTGRRCAGRPVPAGACPPGFILRQHEPIAFRWRPMIPAT
jgi:hypothetical protein